jgi:hypothetical protein
MSKYLDKSKVEQAFKRAASAVTSGDKDARAGRFVHRSAKDGQFVSANRKLAASALPVRKEK